VGRERRVSRSTLSPKTVTNCMSRRCSGSSSSTGPPCGGPAAPAVARAPPPPSGAPSGGQQLHRRRAEMQDQATRVGSEGCKGAGSGWRSRFRRRRACSRRCQIVDSEIRPAAAGRTPASRRVAEACSLATERSKLEITQLTSSTSH
jgi:hypothetical protein